MTTSDHAKIVDAVETLKQARTGIVITGKIQNGKLVIDQECLDHIAEKFPDANKSFVAMNAPFDPT